MKHIKLLAVLSILLGILYLFCACRGTGDDPVGSEAESDTSASAVTDDPTDTGEIETPAETETEPEPVPVVELIPNTLTVEGDKVKVNLTVTVDKESDAHLCFSLQDGSGELDRLSVPLVSGTADYELTCGADKVNSELTLYVDANGTDGTDMESAVTWASATLKLKNGLPQLTPDGIRCVVAAMTLEEKAQMVTGIQEKKLEHASGATLAIPRLGVPSIYVNDGPAGVRYGTSIWYPSVINISSSWDTALAQEIGVSMAEDALVIGIDIILAPGMNIQKNVLCGRNFEYVSEDPILTAAVATAYTQGIQSRGVGVSLKHFAVNNQETARTQVSSNLTERALREIYLKAFGMVIEDADPYTVMSSYNLVNGQRVALRYDMLVTYLRGEVGFKGFVTSDWGSGGSVVDKVNAGNDINMPGSETDPDEVIAAYEAGLVDPLMLDAACQNILGVVVRCPAYTGVTGKKRLDYSSHGKQIAEAAADTMVLLKNEGSALPLADGTSVAVFGNGAVQTVFGGAGSGSVSAQTTVSIIAGLNNADGLSVFDKDNNPFIGCEAHSAADASKDVVVTEAYAKKCADGADVAVIVISRGSTEGSDRSTLEGDFKLNQTERDMISRVSEAFHAKGKKVVVLLNIGSPIEIVSWRDSVDAILWVGYPGERAGVSVAKVLTGEVNPSAKTTITWPTTYNSTPAYRYFPGNAADVLYYEDIYVGYRYYETFDVEVAYPFGYGLSYTSFAYSDLTVEKQADGSAVAKVTVKNTGAVAGREIAQIYVSKPETTLEQAALELCGFGKTKLLAPNESETLTIVIPVEALESYDTENSRYFIDKGTFTFSAGASSADIKETATLEYGDLTVVKDVENIAAPDTELEYIQKDTYKIPTAEDLSKNIALGKETFDNGHEGDYISSRATDGDRVTRWSGLGTSESIHRWTVDLGEVFEIGKIMIFWEYVEAPFTLAISEDGQNYRTVGIYVTDETMTIEMNLYGEKARYLRLGVPVGGYCSIFEFEAYEVTAEDLESRPADGEGAQNLALGKPVTATAQEGGYRKDYAVDGNYDTRWGSLPTGQAWLQVDLGEVTDVSEIRLYLESAYVPYRIEISDDGQDYETLYNGDKDELAVILTELDIETRYIRLYRDGANWFSIIELEVFQ